MAFLDDLSKNLGEVRQTVKEKSGEFIEKSKALIEINKIKLDIRTEEGKIQKLFIETGKQAYAIYGAGGDYAGLMPLMEQVKAIEEKIGSFREKIEDIKKDNPEIKDDEGEPNKEDE